jgi:integrase
MNMEMDIDTQRLGFWERRNISMYDNNHRHPDARSLATTIQPIDSIGIIDTQLSYDPSHPLYDWSQKQQLQSDAIRKSTEARRRDDRGTQPQSSSGIQDPRSIVRDAFADPRSTTSKLSPPPPPPPPPRPVNTTLPTAAPQPLPVTKTPSQALAKPSRIPQTPLATTASAPHRTAQPNSSHKPRDKPSETPSSHPTITTTTKAGPSKAASVTPVTQAIQPPAPVSAAVKTQTVSAQKSPAVATTTPSSDHAPPSSSTVRTPRARHEEEMKEEPQPMMDLCDEKTSNIVMTHHNDHSTGAMMSLSTVLRDDEIVDLKRFHDNSLATNTRKAYMSDHQSFVTFLEQRFPNIATAQLQAQCTLEHVLAYINQQCNNGKKISTINRRLSTIKKHILPGLFHTSFAPGSREEQIHREMDTIVRGIRRTIGAEQRVRGKRPLLIENIIAMCEVAALKTSEDGGALPNTRCRDVCLLLFLFFSAMRRSEVEQLLWSDLTFDTRGVVVRIGHSKTDHQSRGQTIAISRLDGAASERRGGFCPVKALEAWRGQSRGEGESPVFRYVTARDVIQWRVLTDQRIVAIIKHYAGKIGLDSRCFAAHSTRSGYVTSSSSSGVPISEIMLRTRHKSLGSVSAYMKSDDLFSNSGDRRL